MMYITSTTRQKTNDALHKQQSMPNDAALYINGLGNGFIAFTRTFWRFVCAYAGLLVDGFDDNGVWLSRSSIKKHWGWHVPSMLIGTHRLAILISAFWRCLYFWLWRQWLPQFLVQKEPQERLRRFKSESQSVPSNCYKKDRRWQSSWVGIWHQPKIGEVYYSPST
jgi:hypothetical protein